ncbi:hypothetical protein 1 [Wenzhou picorna-like virus 42]|uniref:hypothetical protein 1 n=1 Tax=Wenzhou picorna-like virus 42 TaxID=1923629 RepID=UPI000909EA36|nr:hypothetical protein 1 [Wenzhou picorna-like virus 42]APG78519.1 hypothetical protein 1 [Wenzhou picorna-like virus 42]
MELITKQNKNENKNKKENNNRNIMSENILNNGNVEDNRPPREVSNTSKVRSDLLGNLDYVTLPKGSGSYYILNCQTGYLIAVKKQTFIIADYPVLEWGEVKVKFYSGTRPKATEIIRRALGSKRYAPEAILDDLVNTISELMRPVLQTCRGGVLVARALSTLGGNVDAPHRTEQSWMLMLKLLELINTAITTSMSVSVNSVIALLIRVTLVANDIKNYFTPESGIEAMLLAIASLSLPPTVVEAFKRLSLFSNVKILDDVRVFKDIMLAIDTIVVSVLVKLFPSFKDKIESMCGWASHHFLIHDITKLLKEAENTKNFMSDTFRERVKDLYKHVNDSAVLLQWRRNNGAVDTYMRRLERTYKVVLNFEGHSRAEPICFAFEGGPGVGKSLAMGSLYKASGLSHYSHVTKAASDGKDFWDGYNYQDVVTCDDLGQQGISQYRFLINIVSPIKYPLDCAAAELKDTKFFSSKALLFTTNLFSEIQNISKTDMITDITALWRRVVVFKFISTQHVEVRHYSTAEKQWRVGAPMEWRYTNIHKLNPVLKNYTQEELTAWLLAWFELALEEKALYYENNTSNLNVDAVHRRKSELLAAANAPDALQPQAWYSRVSDLIDTIDVVSSAWRVSEWIPQLMDTIATKALDFKKLLMPLALIFGCVGLYSLTSVFRRQSARMFAENTLIVKKIEDSSPSTSGEYVRRQVKYVKMEGTKESTTIGLLSGHYIVVVAHSVLDKKGKVTIYNGQPELDLRMVDHAQYELVYEDLYQDVAVLKHSHGVVVPFKKLDTHFLANFRNKGLKFLHPDGCVVLNGRIAPTTQVWYEVRDTTILLKDNICYRDLQGPGFCGSIVFDEDAGIKGMHVAGDPQDVVGCAVVWSPRLIEILRSLFREDGNVSQYEFSDRPVDSGLKIDKDFKCNNIKVSNIIPSPLYGVFPVTKEPVNPSVNGPHTVKDSLKEALCHVNSINNDDLESARRLLGDIIEPYTPITDYVNIKGDEVLAPMKDDTACGIGLNNDRHHYIDFEKGDLTPAGVDLITNFETKCVAETLDISDVIAKETVKDEIRPLTKNRFPRTFRIIPLHVNFMLKKYLGNVFKQLIRDKWVNGLMLQINPYSEFHVIYNHLRNRNLLALDVSFWDKKMVVQVMHMVREVLVSKLTERYNTDRKVLDTVLANIIQGYVAANDDTYWLTHSMASGTWITNMFNSLVQLSYVRMWYNSIKPNLSTMDFYNDLALFILGDDIICGVSTNAPELNAFTMRDYYTRLGLRVTSSVKKDIVNPYESWEDVTFLKRRFYYHLELKKVVGVLSEETLLSSISWVDASKNIDTVVEDKIRAFQLEAYLNPEGDDFVDKLENTCVERGVAFKRWPKHILLELFRSGMVKYHSFDGTVIAH